MLRIILVIFFLSILLFAYPAWRLGSWLELSTVVILAFTVPLFLSQFIARFGLRHSRGTAAYIIRGAADFALGISPVLLIHVLLAEIVLLIVDISTVFVAILILCSATLIGLFGLRKAWRPEVVDVRLSSEKLRRRVRFVQISDVHIGSRTSRFLEQLMDTVNGLQPEFLCITGDFIDQPGVSEEKLKSLRSFNGPIYYCTGNHEHYEDLEDILRRLRSLGVEVLRGRSVALDGLQIIGIDDAADPKQVAKVLQTIDVRDEDYTILLYHRPHGLEDAQQHGVNLKLSGHTHNGQIMPFHLAVRKTFRYTRGLYQFKDTYLYVNEGSGTWGPTLRIGTRSEITHFELSPKVTPAH